MNEINFIEKALKNQAPVQTLEKLMNKLPSDLDETAKRYGALTRKRKIKSAVDLFLAIAMYVIMEMSQRLLASTLADTIDISDQAWQKKLYGAKPGWHIYYPKLCLNYPKKAESLLLGEQSS